MKDYLREQPDNIKSFNIVAETAQFVNLVYSNINASNIDLSVQLFETLNEFTVVCVLLLFLHLFLYISLKFLWIELLKFIKTKNLRK